MSVYNGYWQAVLTIKAKSGVVVTPVLVDERSRAPGGKRHQIKRSRCLPDICEMLGSQKLDRKELWKRDMASP